MVSLLGSSPSRPEPVPPKKVLYFSVNLHNSSHFPSVLWPYAPNQPTSAGMKSQADFKCLCKQQAYHCLATDQRHWSPHSNLFYFLEPLPSSGTLRLSTDKNQLTHIGDVELVVENDSHNSHGSSRDLLLYNLQSLYNLLVLRRELVVRDTLEAKMRGKLKHTVPKTEITAIKSQNKKSVGRGLILTYLSLVSCLYKT